LFPIDSIDVSIDVPSLSSHCASLMLIFWTDLKHT
jgi:hypothetical protein